MTSISKGHDNESPGRVKIREWSGCGAISRGRWYVHSSVKSNAAYSAFLLISPFRALGRGFPLPYISERKPPAARRRLALPPHRQGRENAPESARMRPDAPETPPTFWAKFWFSPQILTNVLEDFHSLFRFWAFIFFHILSHFQKIFMKFVS